LAARFFRTCGELAFKKEEYSKLGDEGGNLAIVQKLRAELATLAPQVKA